MSPYSVKMIIFAGPFAEQLDKSNVLTNRQSLVMDDDFIQFFNLLNDNFIGIFPGAKVKIKTISKTMGEYKNINKSLKTSFKSGNLPRARAGQPYITFLGEDNLSSNPSVDLVLEEIGLHFFPKRKQITGIPKKSGTFDLLFNNREYNDSGMEIISTQKLKLIVEKDCDFTIMHVDESDPYWKPDDDVYTIGVNTDSKNRFKKDVAAASRRGHQQIEKGKIREDHFFVQYDSKTRWYTLAVSDGAGKSDFSRKGSEIACKRSVESCLERLTAQSKKLKRLTIKYTRRKSNTVRKELLRTLYDIIAMSVVDAYRKIEAEAKINELHPNDFAATLLMCICKKFEFGWLIGTFGVGDGAVCVYRKENWYANLMGGGESSLEKLFLTTPGIIQPSGLERRIRFTIVDDFTALFLMTNGVSSPKFGKEEDLPCFELWDRFWDEMCSHVDFSGKINDIGEDLLKWLDFWTPGKYDDRTIAMLF